MGNGLKGIKPVHVAELQTLHDIIDMGVIPNFRVAIDGGAYVGGWSDILAFHFDEVHAFEPVEESFDVMASNLQNRSNVRMYRFALLDKQTRFRIQLPKGGRTTMTARQVVPDKNGEHLSIAIDQLNLVACDFIKLDLEGCELLALRGARQTIASHKPAILVEQNGLGRRLGAADSDVNYFLDSLNYRMIKEFGVNKLWIHKNGNGSDRVDR